MQIEVTINVSEMDLKPARLWLDHKIPEFLVRRGLCIFHGRFSFGIIAEE